MTMSAPELDFAVFLIHRLAQQWHMSVPQTYMLVDSSGILDEYIIECYDTLHTLGSEYLVDDITEFARERGVAV
jgi:hypothetical protein